jgi:Leucine-rich repeat (LRR) protein
MGNNFLSGSLPLELKRLACLNQLSLNNNLLSGEVLADVISLPGLQHIDLSGYSFTGGFALTEAATHHSGV